MFKGPKKRIEPLPAAGAHVPAEVVYTVLAEVVRSDQRAGARMLSLSKMLHRRLEPLLYYQVELYESDSIAAFARTVRDRPETARMVRRLWISPRHARSDLIGLLSPEATNDSHYVVQTREQVFVDTRIILRSCRRLVDVALASLIVSSDAVHSYGTACQPLRLTSVNPHSFICGFGAPIFRRVIELNVFDLNLSNSEAEGIHKLRNLRSLQLVSPRDYGDIGRDARILRTILSVGETLEDTVAQMSLDTPQLEQVVVRASSRRAQQIVDAVQPKTCVSLVAAGVPMEFIDDWDALRDLVFDAHEDYARGALDDVGISADPGNVFAGILKEWRSYAPVTGHAPLA